jgi:hypothetical protein
MIRVWLKRPRIQPLEPQKKKKSKKEGNNDDEKVPYRGKKENTLHNVF